MADSALGTRYSVLVKFSRILKRFVVCDFTSVNRIQHFIYKELDLRMLKKRKSPSILISINNFKFVQLIREFELVFVIYIYIYITRGIQENHIVRTKM